jgi:uncharacterized protein YggE
MNRVLRLGGLRATERTVIAATLLGVALLALVNGPSGVFAQDATPVPGTGTPTVTVVGHGSVIVTPDIATVIVGVQITKPTITEAQSEATTQMTAIIDAIKAAGVAEQDIQTSYYSVNVLFNYDNTGNPTEVVGYQVSNQVSVVVRDLDKVGSLLADVVGAGANTIYGITFGVEDPSGAESEARAKAVADARKRAEELAQAAGLSLGRVLTISEGTAPAIPYATSQFAGGKGAAAPVQPGTLEVAVDVQVTFELV